MSSVLIQEKDKTEQLVYFVIKVFQGGEARYPKFRRHALALLITTRKLKCISNDVILWSKLFIPFPSLEEVELTRTTMSWFVGLSE